MAKSTCNADSDKEAKAARKQRRKMEDLGDDPEMTDEMVSTKMFCASK